MFRFLAGNDAEEKANAQAMEYGLTSSAPDALILSGHSESGYVGQGQTDRLRDGLPERWLDRH